MKRARKATEAELVSLIKVFRSARDILLDTVANAPGFGTKVYANTILEQTQAQLERMKKKAARYSAYIIPLEYKTAAGEIYEKFQKSSLRMKAPEHFAVIHNEAIYALAREMQTQIWQGLAQVGRRVERHLITSLDETLRLAGLEAAAVKMASGQTLRQMQARLAEDLTKRGFLTVQYGDGPGAYQVGVDSYANTVARSTTREAGNLARENQLTANGYDLMKMSEHYPTCELCAQLQGRVYSISGDDKRFPPLSKAFPAGYRNVHPNCRHVMTPYMETLQEPEELAADVERSGRPFEDVRSQKEIDLYNRQQSENRQFRQAQYQYERFKMRLADHAPKSFAAFRRIKNAGGDSWGILQAQYKGMGYYQKALKNEPEITKTVTETAKQVGMEQAGLEFRVKSKNRYLKKIKDNYKPSGTEYEVKDILRYTFTAPGEELAKKTLQSIDAFAGKGYNTTEIKNTWAARRPPYRGVNTSIKSPGGQIFEMQYHTPESFDLKQNYLHDLYERWQALDHSSPEAMDLYDKMAEASAKLTPPPGIERVR